MLLFIRISVLITILSGSHYASAQILNTNADSMIIKSVFHLKRSLNLSDIQSDSCLIVYKIRKQAIDSLNNQNSMLENRGYALEGINQLFYLQMKTILNEKQWTEFIQNSIKRRNRLEERVKEKQIPMKELPETEMVQ